MTRRLSEKEWIHAHADQAQHRIRPRLVGGRLVLQQADSRAAGADGHDVVSAQNSLDSLKGDVDAVTRALGRVSSPAILIGHSYGGTVITAAGADDRVAGLVYNAALAPDDSETSQSLLAKFPTADVFSRLEIADGRIWLRRDGIECFAGDLSEEEQKVVWATQGAPAANLLDQKHPEGTPGALDLPMGY
jgi:pimeloyl-ACP methyl ester carboxylesterase